MLVAKIKYPSRGPGTLDVVTLSTESQYGEMITKNAFYGLVTHLYVRNLTSQLYGLTAVIR